MTTKNEYIAGWKSHIEELRRLNMHLDSESTKELDNTIKELEALLEKAANNQEQGIFFYKGEKQ